MSILAKFRSGQARWGRGSLALLTFAWLNVILQPCAMAIAGDGAGCHHSSAAQVHEPMRHVDMAAHGHNGGHDTVARHESDSHGTACGGELSDCANLDDINQGDDREREFSPDLRLAWLAPPPPEFALPDTGRPPSASCSSDAARLAGAFPPLNVLYCVYLD